MGKDQDTQFSNPLPCSGVASAEKELSLSARKLAASLWEINEISPSRAKEGSDQFTQSNKKDVAKKEKSERLSRSHLSDPSYSPMSERIMGGFKGGSCKCNRRVLADSEKLELSDYHLGGLDNALSRACLVEMGNHNRGKSHNVQSSIGFKSRLKEVRSVVSTSKKLLKVLNHIWRVEEENSSSMSLISALGGELDHLCHLVDQLICEQRSNHNEIECLIKHFAEEKAAWKSKERKKISDALACIAEEFEAEKRLRRQTERINKKIGKELADTQASLSTVTKDLVREKRAKEILEQICDELARGIDEDRAQVEELKRESAKVREEVEKEREMLQLADVLREERVQMKLSEAKYQFEERKAILESLRDELDACLSTKIEQENDVDACPEFEKIKELEAYLKKINFGTHNRERGEGGNVEVGAREENEEGDDSVDSELHSIELNMDNSNRSYKWSYGGTQDDSERASMEEERFTRRPSISEKIQWESICFNKGTSSEMLKEENSEKLDRKILKELPSQSANLVDEFERSYKSLKGLKNDGSRITSEGGINNHKHKWYESLPFENLSRETLEDGIGLKQKVSSRKAD